MSKTHQEDYRATSAKLEKFGQGHVVRFWAKLSEVSRRQLLTQIHGIDFELISRLGADYIKTKKSAPLTAELKPAPVITLAHQRRFPQEVAERRKEGEMLLRSGKLAARGRAWVSKVQRAPFSSVRSRTSRSFNCTRKNCWPVPGAMARRFPGTS
jgi:hypothetical protein